MNFENLRTCFSIEFSFFVAIQSEPTSPSLQQSTCLLLPALILENWVGGRWVLSITLVRNRAEIHRLTEITVIGDES